MDPLILAGASAASLTALGALAELSTRALLRVHGRYYVWMPHARTVMPLDPSVFPRGDAVVHFEVNALGERGAPLPADLSRTYRILVGGGSAAECYFLDQPSSWPEALSRELSSPHHLARLQRSAVHVGNVARSLTDSHQLTHLFARILPRYPRSDAVILMTGASDLVRWLEEHTPATLTPSPLTPSLLFARHPEGPFGWTPSTLALRRVASAARHTLIRRTQHRETAGKRLAANRRSRANATRILTTIADPAPILAYYEQHLTNLVRLLQRHSPRVILLRQPWLERAFTPDEQRDLWMFADGRPYAEPTTTYYSHPLIFSILRRIDDVTARVAANLHAESIELNTLIPADFEHYYDEMHHTPKGCALLARIVAEHLLAPQPAPARATT